MATDTQTTSKRIARNTLILYMRMLLMLVIGLFTSRVVLQTLGVDDYGIYNAVGGFVSLFSLLSTALTNAINRFLAYELGKGGGERLNCVFSTSVNVMTMLALVALLLGATLGVWFLNTRMNIPDGRMNAANWVLACSVMTFAMNLLAVPYNSAIVAHEKMSAFAYISLVEAALKLLIVYALYLSPFDKLKVYAVLFFLLALLVRILYGVYCRRHFPECHYHRVHDYKLLKQMTSFAGWDFIAGGAAIINNAGVNVLINLFFGVSVNAARGIAVQVNGHVNQFVTNFMMAVNPQITKSYAQGDIPYLHDLVCRGAKFSAFLMLLFLIPISLEAHQLLTLWLGVVPPYAVPFVQFTLLVTTLNTLSNSLTIALHATGDIRRFMIIVGSVEITMFPLTWIAFLLGASPLWAYYIYAAVYLILTFLRMVLTKDHIDLSARTFARRVYMRVLIVSVTALPIPMILRFAMSESVLRFFIVCPVSLLCTATCIYYLGLDKTERGIVVKLLKKRLHIG